MTMLRLSLREIRLIVERLVQAAGTPPGLLAATRDAALVSATLPVAGFSGLGAEIARLKEQPPKPLRLCEEGEGLVVDARGQHAWFAAEAILDLAVERFRLGAAGALRVVGLTDPRELGVLAGLAERYGLAASLVPEGGGLRVDLAPLAAEAPRLLDRVRRDGVRAEAALWWPLYHASHEALAPDSFDSRRHAGTIRVEADGRIVGRADEDETDLAMLAADPSRLRPNPVPAR